MKTPALALPLLATLCFLGVDSTFSSARADTYAWAGGTTGDFGSANWLDTNTPVPPGEAPDYMAGPPGAGDTASIAADTILSGSGNVDVLSGGGVNGSFTCNTLEGILLAGGTLTAGSIGSGDGTSGLISVTGGQLIASSVASGYYVDFTISGGGSAVIESSVTTSEGSISGAGSLLEVNGTLTDFNGGPAAGGTLKAQSIQDDGIGSSDIFCDGGGSLVSTNGAETEPIIVTNGGGIAVGGDLTASRCSPTQGSLNP